MNNFFQIHPTTETLQSSTSAVSHKKSTLGRLAGITLAVLSFGSLLAYSTASFAQSCPTKVTVCSPGNHCPAPQYRSGPTHTGYSYNDILDATSIVNGCLALKFPAIATNNGSSSWAYPTFGPSSSPSAITRTIFASVDNSGNYGLWSYGIAGGSYGWDTISAGTVISQPIRATPGYPVHFPQPFIFAGSEDGKLYAFGYTNGQRYWTYDTKDWIDSSPVVTDAYEVYVLDSSANIHKVDGNTGKLIWKINSNVYPTATVAWDSLLNSPTVGAYPCPGSCTAVFVAGNKTNFSPNGTGIANAFRTDTGAQLWPNAATFPSPITSTPLLSEAQNLVYVQSTAGFGGRDWTGDLLYALDSTTGAVDWSALPAGNPPQPPQVQPCPNGSDWYYNGGSPAYDDTQPSIGPVVVSVARIQYIIPCSPAWIQFKNSILTAYNAKSKANGGGTVVWTQDIGHSISYSSPSISNGVVYVGTDDGYVLAFDEVHNGSPIWTSPQMLDANGHVDPVLGPPVISWNRIHVTTQSGTLYVYGLPGY